MAGPWIERRCFPLGRIEGLKFETAIIQGFGPQILGITFCKWISKGFPVLIPSEANLVILILSMTKNYNFRQIDHRNVEGRRRP